MTKEKSNKKAVQVKVHSECRSRDEYLPMDIYAMGNLYRKNNHLYLVYDEDEEEEGQSRVILRVEPGKRVTLTRKGGSEMHFVLEKGLHSVGYYAVPEGQFSMGVTTTRLDDHLTEDGGTLGFTYCTDSGGYELFENNITIEINPAAK